MAAPTLRFERLAASPSGARAGILHTRRGPVATPTFMPVATHAHVRSLTMDEVAASGAGICLANTYHLLLRPGPQIFEHFGGIHSFMQWDRGVLTDSGGFQIFSLPGEREITEDGARFRSYFDQHPHMLSPESSIATQQSIGSDIMMVLDVCLPSTSSEADTEAAMERTHRWAVRSLAARDAKDTGPALFAIVQGGIVPAFRTRSAEFLTAHPFDGFAIGGLAVGESRDLLYAMTQHTAPLLPGDKPRYLMGVGTPIDLVESVNAGVDMFDCIIPGKLAQQGYAYTFEGQLRMSRTEYQRSEGPIDVTCPCPVCARYTRGYIRHLTQGTHHLAARLLTVHNLWHYQALMDRMRTAILEGRWTAECAELRRLLAPKSSTPRVLPGSRQGVFELVTLKSGERAVRHTGHGEVMHPVGPWLEANRLYIDQTQLGARLGQASEDPVRILDVGLGAGTNAVAALECAKTLGVARQRELEIVSLEHDLTAIRLALDDAEGFPFLQPWREAIEALLTDGHWEVPGLSWRVLEGDAMERLSELDGVFDLIFFDPFSPESNPALWTVSFLKAMRIVAKNKDALLVTYSAATPTRVGLLLAGFHVGAGLSTGTKGETTVAATRLTTLTEPLGDRWLTRWRRSSARAAHGEVFTPAVEDAIERHPQFRGVQK